MIVWELYALDISRCLCVYSFSSRLFCMSVLHLTDRASKRASSGATVCCVRMVGPGTATHPFVYQVMLLVYTLSLKGEN